MGANDAEAVIAMEREIQALRQCVAELEKLRAAMVASINELTVFDLRIINTLRAERNQQAQVIEGMREALGLISKKACEISGGDPMGLRCLKLINAEGLDLRCPSCIAQEALAAVPAPSPEAPALPMDPWVNHYQLAGTNCRVADIAAPPVDSPKERTPEQIADSLINRHLPCGHDGLRADIVSELGYRMSTPTDRLSPERLAYLRSMSKMAVEGSVAACELAEALDEVERLQGETHELRATILDRNRVHVERFADLEAALVRERTEGELERRKARAMDDYQKMVRNGIVPMFDRHSRTWVYGGGENPVYRSADLVEVMEAIQDAMKQEAPDGKQA